MKSQIGRRAIRLAAFDRDKHKCVVCGEKATDAHHLIERRLWSDTSEGYFLDNLVSLCHSCHLAAEYGKLTPIVLRSKAGIKHTHIPRHLYSDETYDKWGNPRVPDDDNGAWYVDGLHARGELFYDSGVQEALKRGYRLKDYLPYHKYPRTFYLPWSLVGKDDRAMSGTDQLIGKEIVVTEKMDGENTSIYSNGKVHARSINSDHHWSQDRLRAWSAQWQYQLPNDMRVCGENLTEVHSIEYDNLPERFMGFSVWYENTCMNWDETLDWFELLAIKPVPTLYEGVYDEKMLRDISKTWPVDKSEGYVLRLRDSIEMKDWSKFVGKWVRPNHVNNHRRSGRENKIV